MVIIPISYQLTTAHLLTISILDRAVEIAEFEICVVSNYSARGSEQLPPNSGCYVNAQTESEIRR